MLEYPNFGKLPNAVTDKSLAATWIHLIDLVLEDCQASADAGSPPP